MGQTNKDGGKMYIQDKVAEYSDEIFTRMDNGAHMYFCGLKGMMPGITEMLEKVSTEKGLVWADKLKEWKENGQSHVESIRVTRMMLYTAARRSRQTQTAGIKCACRINYSNNVTSAKQLCMYKLTTRMSHPFFGAKDTCFLFCHAQTNTLLS